MTGVIPRYDFLKVIKAEYSGVWNLPVLGLVPAPSAVLVRPDGYVAWVGQGSDSGLAEALTFTLGLAPHQ
jgi:hypothetical protein